MLIVTIMVIVIITTPPGMVESARFRVCILSVGYVPIYDTGKEKLVLPKGKEAHLLIEGGWGNILMHPDTSVGARNEVKLYE